MYVDYEDKTDYKPLKPAETIYFKPDKPCSEPLPPFWLPVQKNNLRQLKG